jgi:hypothetical protein
VMIMSLHASLRAMYHLLSKTVATARMKLTMVIHATRLTMGPLCVDEICGTRATNIAKSAAAIESNMAKGSKWDVFPQHMRTKD